jgi:Na+-driven multidrug efflux pump
VQAETMKSSRIVVFVDLFYMIPQAVANATAILAGNYMGARQGKDAEAVVSLGFMVCFSYGILAGAVLLFVFRPVRTFCTGFEYITLSCSCVLLHSIGGRYFAKMSPCRN